MPVSHQGSLSLSQGLITIVFGLNMILFKETRNTECERPSTISKLVSDDDRTEQYALESSIAISGLIRQYACVVWLRLV